MREKAGVHGTVLLVEDGKTYAELATVLLTDLGWTVLHASTAEEAIRVAHNAPPDLILMDVNLPGMDGLRAIRVLREDPRTKSIPAIALTGDTRPGDEEWRKAIASGFDKHETKPITRSAFRALTAPFIGRAGKAS